MGRRHPRPRRHVLFPLGGHRLTRVLLADDDPDILESTTALLKDEGFEVLAVQRVSDILPTLIKAQADVLLQDVNMPGLDLRALVGAVRGLGRYTPVLLFTAAADAEEQKLATGADDLIGKPFDVLTLRDRIEAWASRSRERARPA